MGSFIMKVATKLAVRAVCLAVSAVIGTPVTPPDNIDV